MMRYLPSWHGNAQNGDAVFRFRSISLRFAAVQQNVGMGHKCCHRCALPLSFAHFRIAEDERPFRATPRTVVMKTSSSASMLK